VIVCDLSLPGMDGYEFIRRARQLPCMDHVPALALSGLGDVPARFMSPGNRLLCLFDQARCPSTS